MSAVDLLIFTLKIRLFYSSNTTTTQLSDILDSWILYHIYRHCAACVNMFKLNDMN